MVRLDWANRRHPWASVGGLALLVALGLFLEACAEGTQVADTAPPSVAVTDVAITVGASTGRGAVTGFLEGIESGSSAASEVVQPEQLAILVGLEDPSGSLMAELLTTGVPPGVASNFWESLAGSFEPFSGAGLDGWTAGPARAVIQNGITFVFVTISHESGTSELVARDTGSGWVVDLIASFGHAFAPVVNFWIDNQPGSQEVWGPVLVEQSLSVEMAAERTSADSIYQEDLAGWADRINQLRP